MPSENVKIDSEILKNLRKYLMQSALENDSHLCGLLKNTVDKAILEYIQNHPLKNKIKSL